MVLVRFWCGYVLVRLPFRMVLKCEFGTAERKPQVEQYELEALEASADAVVAGLGPLAAGLARLAGEACRAVTLDAMEVLVIEQGRDLLRGLVQLSLDAQAAGEARLTKKIGPAVARQRTCAGAYGTGPGAADGSGPGQAVMGLSGWCV